MKLFDQESDLSDPNGKIFCRAYGTIVIENGKFQRIKLKPWPKIISSMEIGVLGNRTHSQGEGTDRCLLYYNQPFFHKRFLALKYVVSWKGTSFRSFRLATRVLDEVARIKRSDAIVCEVSNPSISNRLMKRWGWERHLTDHDNRNFIKRFTASIRNPSCKPMSWLVLSDLNIEDHSARSQLEKATGEGNLSFQPN